MSVPVSTIFSESCFSLTGRVIEERRRRLQPHTVEMLTCVKDWELGDARAQHEVEKAVQDLEDALNKDLLGEGQTGENQ